MTVLTTRQEQDIRIVCQEIRRERERQVEEEGHSYHADDTLNLSGELARAAACYCLKNSGDPPVRFGGESSPALSLAEMLYPAGWTFKPKDPRRDLVRAAALIVAEIERLDRESRGEEHR
jgi:hypothetical protein